MSIMVWIAIFLGSLALLIKAADLFTSCAEKVGIALRISPFIVGVTIVSIGTSLPELASSLVAVIHGSGEMVAANVLGSNITNILLVVGCAAVLSSGLIVKRNLIDLDLPLLASSGAILIILVLWDGSVTFFEGIISLLAYGIYLGYLISSQPDEVNTIEKEKKKLGKKVIFGLIVSGFFVALGANYVVKSVIQISEILNIGKSIIAMSAVAIGTSLPELIVSVSSARKGNFEIAIGSVFGSNIFNSCVALGFPALFGNLPVSAPTLSIALPFFVVATILFIISGITKTIHKWEGWMYLLIFSLYVGKIFNLF